MAIIFDNKKRKILFIIAALFVLVIILFLFLWLMSSKDDISTTENKKKQQEKTEKDKERSSLSQEELRERRMKDVDHFQQAESTDNKDVCKKITDDYTKDQCFKNLAKKNLDPDLCDMIADESITSSCLYYVYFNKALKQKKVDPCRNLPTAGARQQCIDRAKGSNFCSSEECYDEYMRSKKE